MLVIILAAGGFVFFQNKNILTKVAGIVSTPAPTPTPEIAPSSLVWVQTKTNTEGWPKRDSHSIFTFQNKLWILGGLDSDNAKIDDVPDYEAAIYYNDIWNSDDGVTWTRVKEHADFPPVRSASVIYFKDALYMMGGWSPSTGLKYQNGIWRSTYGINWKKVVDKPYYTDREGQIVGRFSPNTSPDSPKIMQKIETALAVTNPASRPPPG